MEPNRYDLLVQALEDAGNPKAASEVNGLCRMVAELVREQINLKAEIARLKAVQRS